MAAKPDIQELLEAGVHFGHQKSRWNPKMRKFIFAERGGIHIIDLKKTLRQLELAQELARQIVTRGDRVLFVCTKKQLRGIIQAEAERSSSYYVTERWLGGMLTNFVTIKQQIRRLKELERGQEEGAFELYTKKERLMFDRERERLEKYLVGVKDMTRLPGALFVIDARKERIAVNEANKLGIPVIAIADTNSDPDLLTVPIAGNDDAIRSVSVITGAVADAIIEARASMPDADRRRADEAEATTYSTETGEAAPVEDQASKRRPRRKRRPRPEVLKTIRSGQEEEPAASEEPVSTEGERPARKAPGEKTESAKAAEAQPPTRAATQPATETVAGEAPSQDASAEGPAAETAPAEEAPDEDKAG